MRARSIALAVAFFCPAMALSAQQPSPDSIAAQRQAMSRLAFLAGHWSGPITLTLGTEPRHLTQAEEVQFKLDGLVMLIEGNSRDDGGKVVFRALAVISFDDSSGTYRFRAYNEGRYLETELKVPPNGFSWNFSAGPAHVANTMHLTADGQWAETTEVSVNDGPPHKSVDMLLKLQP